MKKLLSYLWPQTTRISSDYSGELEITVYNGKKMLDTKNANYSFGSLQQILEIGLSKFDFTNINSTLVLGLGGGSVVCSLREKFGYDKLIHAIELDKKVIEVAEHEFGIKPSENLIIDNLNALEYVATCKRKYDLIIVDIFIDNLVPDAFYSIEFCKKVSALLFSKGSILFNLGFGKPSEQGKSTVLNFFKTNENFQVQVLEKVKGTNTLLISEKL